MTCLWYMKSPMNNFDTTFLKWVYGGIKDNQGESVSFWPVSAINPLVNGMMICSPSNIRELYQAGQPDKFYLYLKKCIAQTLLQKTC